MNNCAYIFKLVFFFVDLSFLNACISLGLQSYLRKFWRCYKRPFANVAACISICLSKEEAEWRNISLLGTSEFSVHSMKRVFVRMAVFHCHVYIL